MMPAASISLTRFQQGVLDRPTAVASCCTVWRESRCNSASSSTSWRSSSLILQIYRSGEFHSPRYRVGREWRSKFSPPAATLHPMETSTLTRPDYQLADSLWAGGGAIFLTGTQALVRLMLMQRQRD